MGRISKFCFIGIAVFLASCRGAESDQVGTEFNDGVMMHVDAIPPVDTLYGRHISLEPELLNVQDLAILDDEYLIIVEEREDEIFKVFRLPDMEFLYSWGRKGQGPGEIPSRVGFGSIIDASSGKVVLHSSDVVSLGSYQVSETSMTFLDREMIMYDGMQNPLNRLTRLNDSTYIATYGASFTELYAEEELIALEPGNRTPLFKFGEYPETSLTGRELVMAYSTKYLAARPDGSRLAAFYLAHQFFRIYDAAGKLIKEVHIEDPEDTRPVVIGQESYRSYARATDEFIYVRGSLPSILRSPTLEIWRWDGTPHQRFVLDPNLTISRWFDVSGRYNRLYAFVHVGEFELGELELYEFDLGH